VAAKRYLCAVVPGYPGRLSAASALTLSIQGGPMNAQEVAEFETMPYASAAVAVRRWDERPWKAPPTSRPSATSGHFRPLLAGLLRRRRPGRAGGRLGTGAQTKRSG
jgi:gamma-butyrobetaine dioxygenase